MKEKISKFWNDHKETIFIVAELTATAAITSQAIVSVIKLATELREYENEQLEIEGQISDEDLTQAPTVILNN